jgi:DNA phosphorothioation-dependent restriction protein DptG
MQTRWYKETVDLYFNKDYRLQYDTIMKDFCKRGIVKEQNSQIFTGVNP